MSKRAPAEAAEDANEIRRIRAVYAEYDNRSLGATLWGQNPGNVANAEWLAQSVVDAVAERADRDGPMTIVDIGCGGGGLLGRLRQRLPAPVRLVGVDLIEERLGRATADFWALVGDACHLPLRRASADVIVFSTVFSSILANGMRAQIAAQAAAAIRPGGLVIVHEMRYPSRNPNVERLSRTDLRQLFPSFTAQLEPHTLVPPLARRLGSLTPRLHPLLRRRPWLLSHYFVTFTAPGSQPG